MSHRHHRSSSFASCFRPTTTTTPTPKTAVSAYPSLIATLYQTEIGLFGLTWSKNLLGSRSLDIHIHPLPLLENSAHHDNHSYHSFPSHSFHLQIKPPPFTFWNRRGSKTLLLPSTSSTTAEVFWDLSQAKFGSRPDPVSAYYVTIFIGGEMALLVGDETYYYYATRTTRGRGAARAGETTQKRNQVMVLRREHVYGGNQQRKLLYTTRPNIGGQERDVSIDYRLIGGDDPTLYFNIDDKRVLQVKHLRWKFRGNERIEVDGIPIQVSWDVHNWLFQDDDEVTSGGGGYALFMLKFQKLLSVGGLLTNEQGEDKEDPQHHHYLEKNGLMSWWAPHPPHHHHHHQQQNCCGFGFETNKMKKAGLKLRSGRSSSSSSLSSASSNCSSSVMEWASAEENELKGPGGFSLVVYAWRRSS